MRKRVQWGHAQKQTNLKIWMHLLQKVSIDNIWFAHGFPTATYTQKIRLPYLLYLFKFDAASLGKI